MKGWKETYTDIVLDEEYGFKEKRLVKDLEKAIDKTGALIKKIPDEYEDSNAYQELAQGQNALEYGIGILPGDFENYLNENKQPKKEISERLDAHKKSPAELKGAQFDRKKEINNIKKMIKGLEKLHKEHEKFQFNNRTTSGDRIFRGLYKAEDALYTYMLEIERGEWDGKVELES